MFIEKSDAELANMSVEDVALYFKSYQAHKDAELKNAIEKNLKSEIEKVKSEIVSASEKKSDTIAKILEKQGEMLEKMSKTMTTETKEAGIKGALKSNSELLNGLKNGDTAKKLSLEVKSMTIGANMINYAQGQLEQGMGRIAERRPFVAGLLQSASLSTDKVVWYEQQNRTGDADVTAEGGAKSASEFEVIEKTANAKKVTMIHKISTEMLNDVAFIESEIRNELVNRINLKVDQQLLSGTGIGAEMTGLLTVATPFSAGSFALSVANANKYDVLAIAINQVMLNNFVPNYVLLNPTDITDMNVSKGSDGHYVLPSFVSPDGREIKATPIIFNNGVPAGQFLVMDSTRATVYTRETLRIVMGYENDDFSKNMVSILGEWRGLNRIKAVDFGAFVKGTFSTAIAAILKP